MYRCGLTHSHEPKKLAQVKAKVAAQGHGRSFVKCFDIEEYQSVR
jgi:hypothetical protein